MEIAPIAGIRTMSLFSPRRVEAEGPAFVIDETARAGDEERSAQNENEERGLEEDILQELEAEETEQHKGAGGWIDVTA